MIRKRAMPAQLPPEVATFLRRVAALRDPDLGIDLLSPEGSLEATNALWGEASERSDETPEELGLFLLTKGEDVYGYGTRDAAAGKVMFYPHDGPVEVAFSSLAAFERALRKAVETRTPLWDLPAETVEKSKKTRTKSEWSGGILPTPESFLDALSKAPLFARVGEPLPRRWKAIPVGSWDEALATTRGDHRDAQHLEARNALTVVLAHEHKAEYRRWRDRVGDLRARIDTLITPVCEDITRRHQLSTSPFASLRAACLYICMEYEYAHIRKPDFFHQVATMYLEGHFPCGYKGWYPNGQHEVF